MRKIKFVEQDKGWNVEDHSNLFTNRPPVVIGFIIRPRRLGKYVFKLNAHVDAYLDYSCLGCIQSFIAGMEDEWWLLETTGEIEPRHYPPHKSFWARFSDWISLENF